MSCYWNTMSNSPLLVYLCCVYTWVIWVCNLCIEKSNILCPYYMGINSYANWKRLKNCKGILIAFVMTKLLDHINSKRFIQVILFPVPEFFPTADLVGSLPPSYLLSDSGIWHQSEQWCVWEIPQYRQWKLFSEAELGK